MMSNFSITTLIYEVISILIALTFHEAMHAFVGFKLGDTTAEQSGRVSLNPLRHIDPLTTVVLPIITLVLFHAPILAAKPVPFNPTRVRFHEYGAALIAAAGPMSNLGLAIIGALIYRWAAAGPLADFLVVFVQINVLLLVFNLIPIPPLDGSRVLYAFAPEVVQNFMDSIEPYGFFIVLTLIFFTGFSSLVTNLEQLVFRLLP